MNDRDLIGKSVVGMAEGSKVGSVRDLVFEGSKLHGLVIKGDHGEGMLPISAIGTIGPDAVTIESYRLVDWNAGKKLAPELMELNEIKKLAVINEAGAKLGTIHDVTFDRAGTIEEIEVRTEGVFGIGSQHTVIGAADVRAIGPNLVTVQTPAVSVETY